MASCRFSGRAPIRKFRCKSLDDAYADLDTDDIRLTFTDIVYSPLHYIKEVITENSSKNKEIIVNYVEYKTEE